MLIRAYSSDRWPTFNKELSDSNRLSSRMSPTHRKAAALISQSNPKSPTRDPDNGDPYPVLAKEKYGAFKLGCNLGEYPKKRVLRSAIE